MFYIFDSPPEVATVCFDDWISFPTILWEFPEVLITCQLLLLHSLVQLIPNHLSWILIR